MLGSSDFSKEEFRVFVLIIIKTDPWLVLFGCFSGSYDVQSLFGRMFRRKSETLPVVVHNLEQRVVFLIKI